LFPISKKDKNEKKNQTEENSKNNVERRVRLYTHSSLYLVENN